MKSSYISTYEVNLKWVGEPDTIIGHPSDQGIHLNCHPTVCISSAWYKQEWAVDNNDDDSLHWWQLSEADDNSNADGKSDDDDAEVGCQLLAVSTMSPASSCPCIRTNSHWTLHMFCCSLYTVEYTVVHLGSFLHHQPPLFNDGIVKHTTTTTTTTTTQRDTKCKMLNNFCFSTTSDQDCRYVVPFSAQHFQTYILCGAKKPTTFEKAYRHGIIIWARGMSTSWAGADCPFLKPSDN